MNQRWLPPVTVALAALVAHARALAAGFVYDDRWTLLENPVVHDLGNLTRLLGATLGRAGVPDAGRPLMLASEMIDWALTTLVTGGAQPFWFHFVNLLLHAGVSLLGLALFVASGVERRVAWLAAALFAVHPLLVEPVAAINYREDLLAGFFLLAALLLAREARGGRLALAAAATLLALGAKENAALAPLLFLVIFPSLPGASSPRRRALLALSLPVALAGAWRWWVFGSPFVVSLTAEIPAAHTHFAHAVPRAAIAFVRGLGQWLWPRGLAPEYPDLPATTGITVVGIAVVLAVGVASVVAVGHRARPLARGWLWAVAAYLPHFGLVALTNLRADRYFYLPALGLALASGALLVAAADRVTAPGPGRLALAGALLAALGLRAQAQGRLWRDDVSVFTAAASADPGSQRALVGLGAARLRAGQSLAALEAADAALALGEAPRARELRGVVLLASGDAPGAVRELARALPDATGGHRAQVLLNLGLAEIRAGLHAEAAAHLQLATRLAPLSDKAALALVRLHLERGQRAEARAALDELRARLPGSAGAAALAAELDARK